MGSPDFSQLVMGLDGSTDYKKAKDMTRGDQASRVTGFNHMKEKVERRLAQLLLARFLLLGLLVEEARKLTGGLQPEHRRFWVLLQAQPGMFGQKRKEDIFTELARLLGHTSTDDLEARIRNKYVELHDLLEPATEPETLTSAVFFCVLDEAQITVRKGRPILRQMWLSWSTVLRNQMCLVLSATGIDYQALDSTLESSVLKPYGYKLVRDIGAFDDPELQAAYIKRYLPAPWNEPQWKGFLDRAWGWLRGR
jgi:hypothetical protein